MNSHERVAALRIGKMLAGPEGIKAAFSDCLRGDLLRMRARRRLKQSLGCSIEHAERLVEEMLTP